MLHPQFLLFPFFLGVGLLAPGWLLGKAIREPAGTVGAFLGSSALLINVILTLDALGIALNPSHMAIALASICSGLAIIAKLRERPHVTRSPILSWRGFKWQRHHWLLVPTAIALSSIVLKSCLDPLSGLDTKFRWNFLALQMLREGNLHFYPALNGEDFLHYSWCDGIAPLVSSLYFWTYISFGQTFSAATAPVVIGQAVLLFGAVYQLAAKQAGASAGYAAMAILATTCIFLSGVAIGQETGLTALSLIAMFVFIERYRESHSPGCLIWAGIAAGTGGLAREYGIIFCMLGVLRLSNEKLRPRDWLAFLLTAFAVMASWYFRNWIKTGNPLYSHNLLGLFPSNPVHTEYIHTINELIGFKANPYELSTLVKMLVQLAGISLALGLIGCIKHFRQLWFWLVASILIACLWLWSVGQTSGGYVYSLRVLTPSIAMIAICGGIGVSRRAHSRHSWLLALILTIPAVDAAERVLFMPFDPFVAWWAEPPWAWLKIRDNAMRLDHDINWAAIREAANGSQVIVTDPFVHSLLLQLGAKPKSYFSPDIHFLFEPNASYTACCASLRRMDVRFIIMPPPTAAITLRQLSHHPFFVALQNTTPAASTPLYVAYDVYNSKDIP